MRHAREHPWFSACLTLLLLGFGAEIICLARWREETGRLRREAAARPVSKAAILSPAQLPEAREELSDQRRRVEGLAARWRGASDHWPDACPYTESQEVYFDLLAFAEEYQRRAGELNIKLSSPAAAKFGFSLYLDSGTGPDAEQIPAIYRQRQIASRLLDKLFKAQPQALLSLQREEPDTEQPGKFNETSADYFKINPSLSNQDEEGFDALAFRLVFLGKTDTLRSFVNEVAGGTLPLILCSVEVRPAMAERAPPSESPYELFSPRAGGASDGVTSPSSGSFIKNTPSCFSVVLEYVAARNEK